MNNYFVFVHDDILQFPPLTQHHVAIGNINKFNRVRSKKPDVQIDKKWKKKLAGCAREHDYVIHSCTLFLEFNVSPYCLDSGFGITFVISTQTKTIFLLAFFMDLTPARVKNMEPFFLKNIN